MLDTSGLDKRGADIVKQLASRLVVFDPEDKGPTTWQKRPAIVLAVESLPYVKKAGQTLSPPLTVDDAAVIWTMVDELGVRAEKSVAAKKYLKAVEALRLMARFELIGKGVAEATIRANVTRVLGLVEMSALKARSAAVLGHLSQARAVAAEISAFNEALKVEHRTPHFPHSQYLSPSLSHSVLSLSLSLPPPPLLSTYPFTF